MAVKTHKGIAMFAVSRGGSMITHHSSDIPRGHCEGIEKAHHNNKTSRGCRYSRVVEPLVMLRDNAKQWPTMFYNNTSKLLVMLCGDIVEPTHYRLLVIVATAWHVMYGGAT